ncbi:(d)CMP kinase [Candidatus Dependentiae bacterium]|nr:(d)CMP kinase [Candidatus Dependentiae bacterium]
MVITIDGPVASGKSSVAKELALRFGFNHVNTGLLYRVVAYLSAVHNNNLYAIPADMRYDFIDDKPIVFWHEVAIDDSFLYSPLIDQEASKISADARLRALLLPIQQALALTHKIIADGRDCGSVVFPQAKVKLFLTAETMVRAQRLMDNQDRHYAGMSVEEVAHEIIMRDNNDKNRDVAPLLVPTGAVIVDSTELTFEQTVEACQAFIQRGLQDQAP